LALLAATLACFFVLLLLQYGSAACFDDGRTIMTTAAAAQRKMTTIVTRKTHPSTGMPDSARVTVPKPPSPLLVSADIGACAAMEWPFTPADDIKRRRSAEGMRQPTSAGSSHATPALRMVPAQQSAAPPSREPHPAPPQLP